MTDEGTITIASTRSTDGDTPACLIRWGAFEKYAPVEEVRRTAEDLMTCAAYADLIGELLRAGLPADIITGMVQSMLGKRQPRHFGTAATMFLLPGGSSQRGEGVVLAGRRDLFHKGHVDASASPDEARDMARVWMGAAEASEADTLFHAVLDRAGWLSGKDLDAVFGLVADIRAGTAKLPDLP